MADPPHAPAPLVPELDVGDLDVSSGLRRFYSWPRDERPVDNTAAESKRKEPAASLSEGRAAVHCGVAHR
jgi:hypothetical protein